MVRQYSATSSPSFCLEKGKCARDFCFCLELGSDSFLSLEWCRWARASAPAPWIHFFLWEQVPEQPDQPACAVLIKQGLTQCKGFIYIPPPSLLHSLYPCFFSPSVFSNLPEILIHFSFPSAPEKTLGHSIIFFNLSMLDYLCIIDNVCPNSRTNIHSRCHPHAEGDVPHPGSRHTRLSRIRCGAECAKQSTRDRGEMAKTPWPQIGGSPPAPSCETPIKRQHFCASRAGRTKPLKPDSSQIPGTVFMASVGWIHPHFKAERVCLYFFLAFVHQKKPTLAEPCYKPLPAPVVQPSAATTAGQQAVNLGRCFVTKEKIEWFVLTFGHRVSLSIRGRRRAARTAGSVARRFSGKAAVSRGQ